MLGAVIRTLLLPRRWHSPGWWWRRVAAWEGRVPRQVESIVIPCSGSGYVAEARLCAEFAAENSGAGEILIVSDQPAASFGSLPSKVGVRQLDIPSQVVPEGHPYANIWRSRWIKLSAPLQSSGSTVLMIDSDLLLLRKVELICMDGMLLGTLYRGKIGHRMKKHLKVVPELGRASRLWVKWHVNGGFLFAGRSEWERLIPRWHHHYKGIWTALPGETPVDQIPLVMALEETGLRTGDLGIWYNWSVSKRMGGRPGVLPSEVIGAHGGFPLSEWDKYRINREAEMNFLGEDYTRKVRYQKKGDQS